MASTSSVASTPVGGPPRSAPASRPTLSGSYTRTPTSSKSARSTIVRNACRPTLPVPHWIRRYATSVLQVVLEGPVEVRREVADEVREHVAVLEPPAAVALHELVVVAPREHGLHAFATLV